MKNNHLFKCVLVLLFTFILMPILSIKGYAVDLPVHITISDSIEHGRVFSDRDEAALDEEIYLAALPEPGYVLDYYTINGQKIVPNHFNYSAAGTVEVSAVFIKSNRKLTNNEKAKIDKVADIIQLDRNKLEGFIQSLPKISELADDSTIKEEYYNQPKLLLDLIRPVFKSFYSLPYDNEATDDDPDSLVEWANSLEDQTIGCVLTDEEYIDYAKEIVGFLLLSYNSVFNEPNESNLFVISYEYDDVSPYNILQVLIGTIHDGNTQFKTAFNNEFYNFVYWPYLLLEGDWHGDINDYEEYYEYYGSACSNYITSLESNSFEGNYDDYNRYYAIVNSFITYLERYDFDDEELMQLNKEIAQEAMSAYNEWVNSNLSFDEVFDLTNRNEKIKYVEDEIALLQDLLEQEALYIEGNPELKPIRIELVKKEIRTITKVICDLTVFAEAAFYENEHSDFRSVYSAPDYINSINGIMDSVYAISTVEESIVAIHTRDLLNDLANNGLGSTDYARKIISILKYTNSLDDIKAHYNSLKTQIKNDITPKSSSKKYKANDTKDTAEKISGSGKKGSTRTITPIEGKKVASVIVTDKDGNKVDVTLNEDGTYSFVQPASNVDVQINYKNREITLNIGSTEASVDGETSNLDVAPILRNDRTMLPIRFVAENLGAKVEWDEKNPNYVVITRGDTKIEITLGSDIMKVNGKDVILDSVAFAENDRTYLPVRAVSEALNAIVEWNEEKPNEVKIYEQ